MTTGMPEERLRDSLICARAGPRRPHHHRRPQASPSFSDVPLPLTRTPAVEKLPRRDRWLRGLRARDLGRSARAVKVVL